MSQTRTLHQQTASTISTIPLLFSRYSPVKAILISVLSLLLCALGLAAGNAPRIVHNQAQKTITLSDGADSIHLRISYRDGCLVDQLRLMGKELFSRGAGVRSSIHPSSAALIASPTVSVDDRKAVIEGIGLGGGATEKWTLEPLQEGLRWRIDRTATMMMPVDDAFSPDWIFPNISAWTGALLGNGGVAWFALFDSAHATYGVHTSEVLLWKRGEEAALRIAGTSPSGDAIAVRFTRKQNNALSLGFSISRKELLPKYDPGLHRRRYLPAREDIWAPHSIPPGTASVEYRIQAVNFQSAYDPGMLPPFDAREIQMIANTVARIGVIDSRLHGGNSWRTPYGPICLHEQYIAQLGLIMQDTNYFNDYRQTLDSYRDHAIMLDGRVKSRWAYTCEDAMPGTCDSLGFYEAQWGYLFDSNPDYVTNVAELFDFTGDQEWLRTHKASCEKALEYLLRRDSDGDGLVEMMTDDHRAARGSDWIDVIWAAHENAFINAKLYYALTLWSDIEQLFGDLPRAETYSTKATRLKASFNRSTNDGGFWSPSHNWYVHWRDKDGSIHGDNLVTFVNFMAIAYGICDDQERSKAILKGIEDQMSKEDLFFWPICMFSYQPDEGLAFQFPFPSYENGDIFLSLGELGIRAYKDNDPAIPIKYIKKLIARYEKDGLAFQRYLRKTQEGAGDDILAGNALPIVGLYRDIYGIQPKYNRLYIEPHITAELSKTVLNYRLRGQLYQVHPSAIGHSSVKTGNFSLSDVLPFGVHCTGDSIQYFQGKEPLPFMSMTIPRESYVGISIQSPAKEKSTHWKIMAHMNADLAPAAHYMVLLDGSPAAHGQSSASGLCEFTLDLEPGKQHTVELRYAE